VGDEVAPGDIGGVLGHVFRVAVAAGPTTADCVRLLCRVHREYEAERAAGAGFDQGLARASVEDA
jgi:hypothetical protein